VGGRGGRDGRRRARAAQTPHHPGAIAHTKETRPCRPPNPTCRPTACERVWGACVILARSAGALALRNWSRTRTDQRPCVSSSHVEPVHSGAVPARKNVNKRVGRAGETRHRSLTTQARLKAGIRRPRGTHVGRLESRAALVGLRRRAGHTSDG